MNMLFRPPTETEMAAFNRRQGFRNRIAKAAAALTQKNQAPATLKAEAVPAEPDPPAPTCPECIALKAALAIYRPEAGRAYPPIKAIQAVVASFYNVSRADICSDRRMAEVVRPRQIAMYLVKELTPFSLPQIGRQFGGRDHTTVLHAFRKISGMVFADAAFAIDVISLRLLLESGGD